jgi:26S proteasome regulatory subunit N3
MPERRSLRSNKTDTPSSSNKDRPRTNSTSSSANKEKQQPPTRSASSRTKSISKKVVTSTAKDTSGEQPHMNGSDPNASEQIENGVDIAVDPEADDLQSTPTDIKTSAKDNDGDEEMTVIVPTSEKPTTSRSLGSAEKGDTVMNGIDDPDGQGQDDGIGSQEAAIQGTVTLDPSRPSSFLGCLLTDAIAIKANFGLLEKAVSQFDSRLTLRVLRSISSVRKHLSADVISKVVMDTYPHTNPMAKTFLDVLEEGRASDVTGAAMDVDPKPIVKASASSKEILPEVDVYITILCQVHIFDRRAFDQGTRFSTSSVEHLRTLNRRTLDSLAARVYFYYSLFYEKVAPLPPSPIATVISIRQDLLTALRTATLRKDQDTQETVTTLLLRNYLSTSHISQADLLINHTNFPSTATNNQFARYLYYLGRIRAIQLNYSEAHENLISATRKAPSSYTASGFYQAATKLLVVVELLMGDIPDRAIFRQPSLERAMQPYLQIVRAVNAGSLESFNKLVQKHNAAFRRDGTYTLILRLRQNVIKTGIRTMSLSYSRIRLRDIVLKLGLKSEESAEYIVGKTIRDDVIEATLDHEQGYMKSKEAGDVYATREPGDAFHDRISACLALHDESVKVCLR